MPQPYEMRPNLGRISYVLRFSYFLSGKKVITAPTMPPAANTTDHLKLRSKIGSFPKPSIKRIQTKIIAMPCGCLFIRSLLQYPVCCVNFSTLIIYCLYISYCALNSVFALHLKISIDAHNVAPHTTTKKIRLDLA